MRLLPAKSKEYFQLLQGDSSGFYQKLFPALYALIQSFLVLQLLWLSFQVCFLFPSHWFKYRSPQGSLLASSLLEMYTLSREYFLQPSLYQLMTPNLFYSIQMVWLHSSNFSQTVLFTLTLYRISLPLSTISMSFTSSPRL